MILATQSQCYIEFIYRDQVLRVIPSDKKQIHFLQRLETDYDYEVSELSVTVFSSTINIVYTRNSSTVSSTKIFCFHCQVL